MALQSKKLGINKAKEKLNDTVIVDPFESDCSLADDEFTTSSILLYGGPKTGKTQKIAELALSGYYVIGIDADAGMEVAKKLPVEAQKRIIAITPRDTSKLPRSIKAASKLAENLASGKPFKLSFCKNHGMPDCALCKGDESARWIVLDSRWCEENRHKIVFFFDSLTQIADAAYNFAMVKAQQSVSDYEKAGFETWRIQGTLLNQFLSDIQAMNYNRIVCTHEDELQLEGEKQEKIAPTGGTRNQSKKVARYFGHVCRLILKAGEHKGISSTSDAKNCVAGSRTDIDLAKGGTLADILGAETLAEYETRMEEQRKLKEEEEKSAKKLLD